MYVIEIGKIKILNFSGLKVRYTIKRLPMLRQFLQPLSCVKMKKNFKNMQLIKVDEVQVFLKADPFLLQVF